MSPQSLSRSRTGDPRPLQCGAPPQLTRHHRSLLGRATGSDTRPAGRSLTGFERQSRPATEDIAIAGRASSFPWRDQQPPLLRALPHGL